MAKTVALQFFHLTQIPIYNWRIFMTRILSAVCITLFLALAFVSFHAYSSKANASTVATEKTEPAATPGVRCPNIHRAVQALESAMNDMEKASNNYCGHKAEAMDATRIALDQLRRAENCQDCR